MEAINSTLNQFNFLHHRINTFKNSTFEKNQKKCTPKKVKLYKILIGSELNISSFFKLDVRGRFLFYARYKRRRGGQSDLLCMWCGDIWLEKE